MRFEKKGRKGLMSEEASITNPLGTEKIEKLMIRYAIPSIISFVVNSLYNMVDQKM